MSSNHHPSSSYRSRRPSFHDFDAAPESLKRLHSPPLSPPVDEETRQIKKLQLRKAHFQAKSITSQHTSSASGVWSSEMSSRYTTAPEDSSARTSVDGAYQQQQLQQQQQEHYRDNGILQEVSNSSLRRRNMRRNNDVARIGTHAAAIFDPPSGRENSAYLGDFSPPMPKGSNTIDNIPRQRPLVRTVDRTADWVLSSTATEDIQQSLGQPSNTTITNRQRTPRATANTNRRSMSGEMSRYIEHLESQLVSTQAQLSSLTSPTTTRNHAGKLRAMNEETKSLRQELLEWETQFAERVQGHLDEHRALTHSLRTQISTLEKDAAGNREKLRVLQAECLEKTGKLEAAEGANYNLERRLEFMSELLGTSPTKINLHAPAPREGRRSPVRRPLSMFSPRLPSGGGLFSPHPSKTFAHTHSPESPSPYVAPQGWEQNPFDRLVLEARTDERAGGFISDASMTTLVNADETSSNRRESFLSESRRDADGFVKPARRMRKFYSGSQGPKALILPATSNAVTLPTPTSMGPTPDLSFRGSYVWEVTPELGSGLANNDFTEQRSSHPMPRPRSATWTKEPRKSTPTMPPRNTTPQQSMPSRSYTTPFATTEDTTRAATNRIISMGSVNGTNLFEELSRMKQDCSSDISDHDQPRAASPIMQRATHFTRAAPSAPPERETLSHKIARRGVTWPVRRPMSFAGHVAEQVQQTLDGSAAPARAALGSAWSSLTLSRPAVEFRWWLIKLLLGDMKRKGRLLRLDKQQKSQPAGLGLGIEVPPATPLMGRESQGQEQEEEEEEAMRHEVDVERHAVVDSSAAERAPPIVRTAAAAAAASAVESRGASAMTWLKFSMTLVLAVGIAVRDGPGALFTTTTTTARATR